MYLVIYSPTSILHIFSVRQVCYKKKRNKKCICYILIHWFFLKKTDEYSVTSCADLDDEGECWGGGPARMYFIAKK